MTHQAMMLAFDYASMKTHEGQRNFADLLQLYISQKEQPISADLMRKIIAEDKERATAAKR